MNKELEPTYIKQWVSLPIGSMALRVGSGVLDSFSAEMRVAVGHPERCVITYSTSVPDDIVELLTHDLTTIGFIVKKYPMPDGEQATSYNQAEKLFSQLAEAKLTGDDLLVAIGDSGVVSSASFVANAWCGGVSLALVPLDLEAATLSCVQPRALSVMADRPRTITCPGVARYCFVDLDTIPLGPDDEHANFARALMVSTAMSESVTAFSRVWDTADDLREGNLDAMAEQIADAIKVRGRLTASAAIAIRQSVQYGFDFMYAMERFVPGQSRAALFADGLRFAARISVAKEDLDINDMLAQDELLEKLGIGSVTCDISAEQMIAALKAECFRSTNRFMIVLPLDISRVRLSSVDEDLLCEHAQAWCDAHRA